MDVYLRRFFLFLAVCILLCTSVCAADPDGEPDPEEESPVVSVEVPVVVQGSTTDEMAAAFFDALAAFSDREPDEVIAYSIPIADDSGIAPASIIDPSGVTEPAGTLKVILTKIIGPYNPVVVQYRYQTNTSGAYSYIREIQPDFIWCCSAGLFALLIYCTFRLGGALLRKI